MLKKIEKVTKQWWLEFETNPIQASVKALLFVLLLKEVWNKIDKLDTTKKCGNCESNNLSSVRTDTSGRQYYYCFNCEWQTNV